MAAKFKGRAKKKFIHILSFIIVLTLKLFCIVLPFLYVVIEIIIIQRITREFLRLRTFQHVHNVKTVYNPLTVAQCWGAVAS